MLFHSEREALNRARDEAKRVFSHTQTKPKMLSRKNFSTFSGELVYASKLVAEEKEILFFAMLQWLVIGLAYTLWTQILDWIPDELWQEVKRSVDRDDEGAFTLVNLVFLAWSFFIILVASYPISLLNAAMTAAHYLRSTNQTSTIAKCLNIAAKNLSRLWIYTTIDAWITVTAILDRLPSKENNRTAADELLYYAWKIGTIGVLPSLVAGRNYKEAASDSVKILRTEPLRAIGIRMGYSLICWIIGIAAYIGAMLFFVEFGNSQESTNRIYNFYFLMIVPIFIAVGVTAVVVRPFFLIMLSKLYTDILSIAPEAVTLKENKKLDYLALSFAVMLSGLLLTCFLAEHIGLVQWIETLSLRDIETYRQEFP